MATETWARCPSCAGSVRLTSDGTVPPHNVGVVLRWLRPCDGAGMRPPAGETRTFDPAPAGQPAPTSPSAPGDGKETE